MKNQNFLSSAPMRERGLSLIVILLLLVVVSMLGIASMQVVMMTERGARNDRDLQLAWQSAESALVEAEFDLTGPNAYSGNRLNNIQSGPTFPDEGCFDVGTWRGFCAGETTVGSAIKPTWLAVDLSANDSPAVPLGLFTNRNFSAAGAANGVGLQPALAPRYLIEDISYLDRQKTRQVGSSYAPPGTDGHLYRITAIGFGPRRDVQAVLQMVYRN